VNNKLLVLSILLLAFALLTHRADTMDSSKQAPPNRADEPGSSAKVRALTNRKFERTPKRLERGRYLVDGPCQCLSCHSPSDLESPGRPPIMGKEGAGFDYTSWGYPGEVARNITPDLETGVGTWTDDMLARVIREGVGHDGHLIDPSAMPYEFFRALTHEDLASIIVYIRSIPTIRNALPRHRKPDNLVTPFAIPITAPIPPPDFSSPVKRGMYLAQIAGCQWCHTLRDEHRQPLPGLEFGGGDLIIDSYDQASSANLTPDPSGINYYDEAQFLKTIRTGSVGARRISPIMPWWNFNHMTDDDLKAIFAYLRTLEPVRHEVDNTEPVAYCRVCRRKHAGGALN
jgi:mono/diheme cytochrome c family protein